MLPADQRLFSDDQLWQLEERFERIHYHAGQIRPRSPWAPPLPKDAPKLRVPYEVVFRKPTPAEAQTFRKQATDDAQKHKAQEVLARATVIAVAVAPADRSKPPVFTFSEDSPDPRVAAKAPREAFDRLLVDYPLIGEAVAGDLGELAGATRDEQEKD